MTEKPTSVEIRKKYVKKDFDIVHRSSLPQWLKLKTIKEMHQVNKLIDEIEQLDRKKDNLDAIELVLIAAEGNKI